MCLYWPNHEQHGSLRMLHPLFTPTPTSTLYEKNLFFNLFLRNIQMSPGWVAQLVRALS